MPNTRVILFAKAPAYYISSMTQSLLLNVQCTFQNRTVDNAMQASASLVQ